METQVVSRPSGDFLKEVLRSRTEHNPHYSLRALARDLSVSHAYLSFVISGKKPLSTQRAVDMGERLKMPPEDRSAFIQSTLRSRSEPRKTKAPLKPLSFEELRLEHFKLLSEWYHLPLFELLEIEGFQADYGWIARQLGIKRSEAESAVKRFERLGLLEIKDGKWRKLQKNIAIWPNTSYGAIRSYHRQMISKAMKALAHTDQKRFSERSISAVTIPVDPAKLEGAKEKIKRFRHSLFRYLSEGNPTAVYQFNLQLFPISKGPVAPGRKK